MKSTVYLMQECMQPLITGMCAYTRGTIVSWLLCCSVTTVCVYAHACFYCLQKVDKTRFVNNNFV